MAPVHIVDAARTPHGRFLGGLADVGAVDLGGRVVSGLVERTDIDPGTVDWVALGQSIQAGVGQVPARQAALAAGLPDHVPATTVNEASGSGLRAIALAVDRIESGRADLAVAGGMESMSNAPFLLPDYRQGHRLGDAAVVDALVRDALWDVGYDAHMGELTEALVRRFGVTREAQDAYAAESNRRALDAIESGAFDDEVLAVETPEGTVDTDEGPRETTPEALAGLDPVFDSGGTITPGNASSLSDGAGAVLLATGDAVDAHDLTTLATVEDYAVAYRDPKWFGAAAGDAVERLLAATDLGLADVAHLELNEAFAAQMVYVRDRLGLAPERHNPLGGAVALGHPIGASGGILTTTLAHALEPGERGVVGMSIGGGGGIAMLLTA